MYTGISTYLIYVAIPLIFCLIAQFKIKRAYNKYSQVRTHTGVTGAEAARKMLNAHDLDDVAIEKVSGTLTDYYDPSKRTLRLSDGVYSSNSIAAVAVACHESGHAYQHAENYAPLKLRTAVVPTVNIGSNLGIGLFFVGLILSGFVRSNIGYEISVIGLILFSLTAVFAIITLPVEFNASKRAKEWLTNSGLLYNDEEEGVSTVLNAAAMTYVAAAIQSFATVLYYASMLNNNSKRD